LLQCIYFVYFFYTGSTNYTAILSGGWRHGVVWPYAILAGALFIIRLCVVWLRFRYKDWLFQIPLPRGEHSHVRPVMIELLAAPPVGADGEHSICLKLFHSALHLPLGVPGRLSNIILAGRAPPSMLLAILPHQGADAVHD
jgi:hypothetical protein